MRRLIPHIRTVLTAIIILVLSIGEPGSTGRMVFSIVPHADKVFHILMYFALTVTLLLEFRHQVKRKRTLILIICGAFAYGVVMELFQKYLTNSRSLEIYDMIANLIGILIATMLFLIFRRLYPDLLYRKY
jgi:VanZ family protein